MTLKLGSLFDGSGGFPLAGLINGIEPVWASEIEKYPVEVTKARLPKMKHLGSILEINGGEIEPVDIITGGSPCQDLSVAGKRDGLIDGGRSNLFFEMIRIIKEMRIATNGLYPRIVLWENVPGAFSSNKGKDFQRVIEEFCNVADDTVSVPEPPKGKWLNAGQVVGNGYSVAWRTFDAQYWGVPQRRKRIYLIADFGSERAGEILFEQEGVRGHSAESGKAGQSAADNAEGSVGGSCFAIDPISSNSMKSNNPNSGFHEETIAKCIDTSGGNPSCNQGGNVIIQNAAGDDGGSAGRGCVAISGKQQSLVTTEEIANTMVATRHKADDGRTTFGVGDNGDPQFTLGAAHEHAVCYAIEPGAAARLNTESRISENTCSTLRSNAGDNQPAVCYPIDLITESRGAFETYEQDADKAGSLKQCDNKGSQVVCYSIREDAKANTFSATESETSLCLQALQPAPTSHHAQNYVVEKCYRKTGHPRNSAEGQGWEETEKADTLNVFDNSENRTPLAVVKSAFSIENHPNDSRVKIDESGLVQTLSSRMGTGGGNTPMVLERVLPPPENPTTFSNQAYDKWDENATGSSKRASGGVYGGGSESLVVERAKKTRKYIIRRLTPLECCRLQGFPDWWENGVAGSDSGRYKMWGNGIALPNAEYVVRKAKQLLTSK